MRSVTGGVACALGALTALGCGSVGTPALEAPPGGARTVQVGGVAVETYTPDGPYARTVAAPESEVWPHLRAVFDQFGVEVTEVKRSQWIMGNPRFVAARIEGERLSSFMDCGRDHMGPHADQHEVTVTLMTQLLRDPSGGTSVNVLLVASARPRAYAAAPIPCTSNRALEQRFVALVEERLAG